MKESKANTSVKKVNAMGLGAVVAVVAVWGFEAVAGITVPGEVAAAFGTMCGYLASLAMPDHLEE
jgi:hypothetical protein